MGVAIGGADGPTAIFVTSNFPFSLIGILLTCLIAYLLGSIVFGIPISRWMFHDDVRTHGSGSAGMTNMLRNYGKLAAALTAAGDVGKGMLAALIGEKLFSIFLPGLEPICGGYVAGAFAVIGHLFPLYFKYKGGKGVLCAAGAIIVTAPVVVLLLLIIFLVQFFFTRIVSLGSIIVAAAYPVCTLLWSLWQGYNTGTVWFSTVWSVVMAILVIWMHRSNIQRLRAGTEYRFGKKKP